MNADRIIDGILDREGGKYSNDPNDSGGPTKWGVTLSSLSEFLGRRASIADVQTLTRDDAAKFFYWKLVRQPKFDQLLLVSAQIADEVMDTGANCGTFAAVVFLQRCLNALNQNGSRYADLVVDGDCGTRTRDALRTYLTWRGTEGESVLLRALNCLQGALYIDLAEKRPKDETFVYGWLLNRVVIS